jgi:hypothetical protein
VTTGYDDYDQPLETFEPPSALLSKDALWQAVADLPTEDVRLVDPAGKLLGVVRMRGLTGRELERYQEAQSSGKGDVSFKNAVIGLVMLSAVNEDGSRMFAPADRIKLSGSPSWFLMKLFEAAGRLSGVTEDDVKEMTSDFDDAQSDTPSSN